MVPDSFGNSASSVATVADQPSSQQISPSLLPGELVNSSPTQSCLGKSPTATDDLDSTKYYGSGGECEGDLPRPRRLRGAYVLAAALLDSTDDEEDEESVLPSKGGARKRSVEEAPASSTARDMDSFLNGEQQSTSTSGSSRCPLTFDSGESSCIVLSGVQLR